MATNRASRLIEQCRRRGVKLTVDDSGLVVEGPLTASLMRELREHRDAVERALLASQPSVMARLWRLFSGGAHGSSWRGGPHG